MEKLMIQACVFLTGLAVGLGAGIITMLPRTQVGPDMVKRCRIQMQAIADMPEDDRNRFWEITDGNEFLSERWRICASVAQIPLKDD